MKLSENDTNLTKLTFYVFHIKILAIVFLLLVLTKCVSNKSCKGDLAPTFPTCTKLVMQTDFCVRQIKILP